MGSMSGMPDNILHLPTYKVQDYKSIDEMHFQVAVPDPLACEECGVQGEFVRFGKRDVPDWPRTRTVKAVVTPSR